jgi:murein L,D-transpeptidase YcbB/YkuD
LKHPKAVYQFYASRSFEMAWLNANAITLTDSLLFFIKSVRLYGLLPQDYHMIELNNLERAIQLDSVCRKEALLTDAFLSIANDLKYGRLDSATNSSKDSLNSSTLENVFEKNQVKRLLEAKEPNYIQYHDLKKSLAEIVNTANSVNVDLLYKGVTNDSIDIHRKVRQIEVNMERWRSEKLETDQQYIWINIPSFQLQVIENGQAIMESRIIVGKPESPTPVLSSLIECITLYPYWYIPRKIAIEEYLPEIQKDTLFLIRNNFDVLDRKGNVLDPDTLDWQTYTVKYFPISLRQREGPKNSLGVIKFLFDNPYAVFLHDTNVKSLFQKNVRMFSHGCIRMEKALELAKYLVSDSNKVDAKLRMKERFTINLKKPISIHVRYFTCEYVNGRLNFYDDVYGLDRLIIDFLYKADIVTSEHDQNQSGN